MATVKELFIDGTVPTRTDDLHIELDIDSATGLLWQDGCTGPMVRQGFLDFSNVEPRFPGWQQFTQDWAARAALGPGTIGGPAEKKTQTSYFYNNNFAPFGATWGGTFAPTEVCAPVEPPFCDPGTTFDPFATSIRRSVRDVRSVRDAASDAVHRTPVHPRTGADPGDFSGPP